MLTAWLVACLLSNSRFSFVEDEATQAIDAGRPLGATLRPFWFGTGMHEHPPLSDVVLHFWTPVAGRSPVLLRLPSLLFFAGGLALLGLAGVRLAGPGAFLPVIALGVLSPYNFHFARLAGWYSFCFLLVAWLTLAWLRYLESPGMHRLVGFLLPAVLLAYSNYYGLVVIGLLLLDGFLIRGWRSAKAALVTAVVVGVAMTPLWPPFFRELHTRTHSFRLTDGLLAGFDLYSLFLSESVAPWFWFLSIPAAIGIGVAIVLAIRAAGPRPRLFFWYFVAAVAGLALTGKSDNKRMLFLSGWLILALASGLTNVRAPRLAIALGFVAALGWLGILTRQWYSAPHFIEPWSEVAARAADSIRQGDLVLSNSPAFLFQLSYSAPGSPKVFTIPAWRRNPPVRPCTVLFVQGVNQSLRGATNTIRTQLQSGCQLAEREQLLPDSGSALKEKLFPQFSEPPYRVTIERYRCP
jgi:hypothetical protein